MHQKRYWLDYDPVALAVLVIGIGMIELLALSIDPVTFIIEAKGTWCVRARLAAKHAERRKGYGLFHSARANQGANALGIDIPATLLARADEVIE